LPGRFPTAIAAWNWYRLNQDQVGKPLFLRKKIVGLSKRNVGQLAYRRLMAGEASAGISIPFVSASAEGSIDFGATKRAKVKDYTVAFWDTEVADFPTLSNLAALIAGSAPTQFGDVAGLPEQVTDVSPISDVSIVLKGVGPSACNDDVWKIDTADSTHTSLADIRDFAMDPTGEGCRFTMTVVPPSEATATMKFQLGLKSNLGAGQNAASFSIKSPLINVTDVRAAVSLVRTKGFNKTFEIPSNLSDYSDEVEFIVNQKSGFNLIFSPELETELILTCSGVSGSVPISVTNERVSTDELVRARFNLKVFDLTTKPAQGQEDISSTCALSGRLFLTTGDNQRKALEFSPIQYVVRHKAPAAAQESIAASAPSIPEVP
jgi:hypothetical protein